MKCTFHWCSETRDPAIGIANLKGKLGNTSTAGAKGQYPLCAWHYGEIVAERWLSVNLLGWEPFPEELLPVPQEPSLKPAQPTDLLRD
jgi:hypothetical protein